MSWGSPVEIERRRRIRVAVWAWAYEVRSTSLVDDATFDAECLLIDPSIETGNRKLDSFFREVFSPHTGQWVHRHPDKKGLDRIFRRIQAEQKGAE